MLHAHKNKRSNEMIGNLKLKRGERFGLVMIGTDREEHKKAVKIVEKTEICNRKKLDNGSRTMISIRHPNLVPLEEVIETETQLYFVMELMDAGNLAAHAAIKPFSPPFIQNFFYQIALATSFCHEHGAVHGNFKLENVYLCQDGKTVKVSSFGYDGVLKEHSGPNEASHIAHLAPEQILKDKSYSVEKADIWALGVILYRMALGKQPFLAESVEETVKLITQGEGPDLEGVDPTTKDLLCTLLKRNPSERPSAKAILEHPWFDGYSGCDSVPESLLNVAFTVRCIYVNKEEFEQVFKSMLHADYFLFKTLGRKEKDGTIFALECGHRTEWIKFRVIVRMKDVNHNAITPELTSGTKSSPTPGSSFLLTSQATETITPPQTPVSDEEKPISAPSPIVSTTDETAAVITVTTANSVEQAKTPEAAAEVEGGTTTKDESEYISVETVLGITFEYISGDGVKFHELSLETQSNICKKMSDSALIKSDLLKENEMYMAAQHLAGEFRLSFERQEKRATVLLLGKTGCGKSSVANKIFGAEIAKVGRGKPVTKYFSRNMMPGKPVIVYDSKGFEVSCANQFKEEMDEYFSSCEDSVHVIWYVVDGACSRFEPFEHDFLSSSPLGVPVIVLINKADLCVPADIDTLKATIEAAQIPCVKGVVATTAVSSRTTEKAPERCPRCESDDISVRRKVMKWRCNGCGKLEDLKELSVAHEGLAQVVNLTHRIVPDIVKESFVASQRVSIRTKLKGSRELIRNFFKNCSGNKTVVDVMARICTLWDLTEPVDGGFDSSSPSDAPSTPKAGCDVKGPGQTAPRSRTKRVLPFVRSLILASESRNHSVHERDDKMIDFDPYAYNPKSFKWRLELSENGSDNEGNCDEGDGFSTCEDEEEDDEDDDTAYGHVMEKVANVMETHRLSLDANAPGDVCSNNCEVRTAESSDSSCCGSESNEAMDAHDLVHDIVAVTICWTQSLMALHLLLVDHGYDAAPTEKSNPKKYHSVLHGCADRAFAYFTNERISCVKEMLRTQDTDTVFDETRKVLRGIHNKLKNKNYNIEYILSSEEKVTQPYSVAYDEKFSSSSYPGELH